MDDLEDPLGLQGIGESWEFLKQNRYLSKLEEFVRKERCLYPSSVYPSAPDVFAWTRYCTPSQVKVVIVGKDPYPNGEGHGLAFSCLTNLSPGEPLPTPSLKNISKAMKEDLNFELTSGNLTEWAAQGVLLLNRILTFRKEGKDMNFHMGKGWEEFTGYVIKYLSDNHKHIVFMLWGGKAKEVRQLIDEDNHKILECWHPAERSARFPKECRHFSKANTYLFKEWGVVIDWTKGQVATPPIPVAANSFQNIQLVQHQPIPMVQPRTAPMVQPQTAPMMQPPPTQMMPYPSQTTRYWPNGF